MSFINNRTSIFYPSLQTSVFVKILAPSRQQETGNIYDKEFNNFYASSQNVNWCVSGRKL